MTYKEMEAEILKIFEDRKNKEKATIFNSILQFSLNAIGKN